MTTDRVITSRDGTNIAIRDHGGTGRDVLFLHGRSRSLVDWGPVLELLTDVRAVAMDIRWHGRSDVGGSVAFEELAADVDAVVDAAALRRPVLVGHSMGGVIATYYAAQRDLCSGVLNIDGLDGRLLDESDDPDAVMRPRKVPPHREGVDHGDDAWRDDAIAQLRKGDDEFGVHAHVTSAFIERAFVRDAAGMWHRRPPTAFYELDLGADTPSYTVALEEASCPVVILLCTGAPKTPSDRDRPMTAIRAAMLRKLTPIAAERDNIRVETIDASHAVIWEKPDEIARLVRSLL